MCLGGLDVCFGCSCECSGGAVLRAVLLTGAQGVGRGLLAASLAQELVSTQHWTDAYWVDMQGISNVVLAGVLLPS